MSEKYLIGVDLGTSSTKAALYRPDGSLVAEASVEVPIYYPRPGVVEQENDDFYRTAAQTVSACLRASGVDPRSVAGIAFDSQMAGIGAVDAGFQSATRFDSWLDMRCQPYIDALNQQYGGWITRLTGCPPTCHGGAKILWWKHEEPAIYARIASFLTPAGYVAGSMAGLRGDQAFIDHTFLHFISLADAQAAQWSDELCARLGVEREKLPRIVVPWEVIGEVTPPAARDFGLAPGTPIAAGCGDTAAGALGAGIVRSGMVFDTAGTAAVLAGCTDKYMADEANRALLTMHSVLPGLWHPLAYIAGGGIALRWFREQFNNGDQAQLSGDEIYEQMTAQADQAPPGSEGLFFSPHLGGRICPAEPGMRGAWVGFSFGHTRAHFFRSILEGIAYEYAYYLQILKEQIPGLSLTEARVIGGGARSAVWNQIKADVLGLPYQRLKRSEFATWGSALIAGRAVGIFDDLAQAATETTQPQGEPVRPRPEMTAAYQPFIAQYIGWQNILAGAFRAAGPVS